MKTLTKMFACLLVLAGIIVNSRASGLATEGNLQAVLDLTGQSPGFVTSNGIPDGGTALMGGVWQVDPTNSVRLSTNLIFGPSVIQEPGGALALLFDGSATNALTLFTANQQTGGTNIFAPASLTGVNPHYSVEVWALAPVLGAYSTMVSWGTTSTASNQFVFGYGMSDGNVGGALNQGAFTINWGPAGAPSSGVYHHLVSTYDGTTTSLYCDGVLVNSSANLQGGTAFAPANNFPINIGSTRANGGGAGENGAISTGQSAATGHARMHIAKVRIMDGVLTASDVLNNYNTDKATYQLTPTVVSVAPIHNWLFNNGASQISSTANVTDIGTPGGATATVYSAGNGLTGLAQFTGSQLALDGGSPTNGAFVDLGTNLLSVLSAYHTNNGLTVGAIGYNSTPGGGSGQVTVEGWLTVKGHPNFWQTYFGFGAVTATNSTNAALGVTANVVSGRIVGLAQVGQAGPGGLANGVNSDGQLSAQNGGYGGINMWLFQQNNSEPTSTKMDLNGNANTYYGGYSNNLVLTGSSQPVNEDDSWYGYGQNQDYPFVMTYYACTWDEPTGIITTYINGLATSRNITAKKLFNIYDRNDWLGRDFNNANPTLEGNYSDFRIYNKVLTAGEILGNYEAGPALVNTGGLGAISDINFVRTTSSSNWVGSTAYFNITADYANASGVSVLANSGLSITVDDPTVIAVTRGMMQFLKPGTTTVHVTYSSQTTSSTITVVPLAATMTHRWSFFDGGPQDSSILPFDSVSTVDYGNGPGFPQGSYGYVGGLKTPFNTGTNAVLITNGAANGQPGWLDFGPNIVTPTYDAMTVEMWASFGTTTGTLPLFSFGDQRINPSGIILSNLGNNGAPNGALPERGRYFIEAYSTPSAQMVWSADDPGIGSSGVNFGTSEAGSLVGKTNVQIVAEYHPTGGFARIYVNGVPVTATNQYLPLLNALVDNYNYIGLSVNSGYPANSPGGGPASPLSGTTGAGTMNTNDMLLDEFRIYNGVLAQSNVVLDLATGPDLIINNPGTFVSATLITSNSILVSQSAQSFLLGTFSAVTNLNLFLYDGNATFISDNSNVMSTTSAGVITGVSGGTANAIANWTAFTQPITNNITVVSLTPVLSHQYKFNTNSAAGQLNWDSVVGALTATNMGNAFVVGGSSPTRGLVLTTNGGTNFGTDFEQLPANVVDSSYIVLTIEAWASFNHHAGVLANYAALWSLGNTNSFTNGAFYVSMTPHSAQAGPFSFVTFTSVPPAPNTRITFNPTDPGATEGGGEISAFAANPLDHQTNVHIVATYHPFGGFEQLYTNGVLGGTNTLSGTTPLSLIQDQLSYLGRDVAPAGEYLDTTIQEFRIYHGLMGPQQVAMDYATGPDVIVNLAAPHLTNVQFSTSFDAGNVFVTGVSLITPGTSFLVDQVIPVSVLGSGSNSVNSNFTRLNLNGPFITNATAGGLNSAATVTSSNPGVIQVIGNNMFCRQPGTTTLTASYVAANPAYNFSNGQTITRTGSITVTVGYGPGPTTLVHRYNFNDVNTNFGTVDTDLVGGVNLTNEYHAHLDGLGHLMMDGSMDSTTVPYSLTYARAGAGMLSSPALSNATFEVWMTELTNTAYERIFDIGADVDSTTSAADTNGLTNCYIELTGVFNTAGPVGSSLKPTNSGIQYDFSYVLGNGPALTNIEEQIVLVFDATADQALIYTNGILATTNSSVPNAFLGNIHDVTGYLGRSHYIATNQNSGLNSGTTDPTIVASYDDIRIYSSAMSSNEVKASFLSGANVVSSPALTLVTNGSGGFVIRYPYYATRTWTLASSPSASAAVATWTPVATTPVTNVVAGVLSTIQVPVTPAPSGNLFYILK